MFSLRITQRSHLFVTEKMAQLIDFEKIPTYFYLDLQCIMDSHPRNRAHYFLANMSVWASLKLPTVSYLCPDSEMKR